MKNNTYIIIITTILVLLAQSGFAQDQQKSLRDRIAKRQQQEHLNKEANNKSNNLPQLSVRAQMKNESNTQDISRATWIREVYRTLDLKKGTNAALYYPETPMGERINLYTLIFKLIANGELKVYDFNNGQDLFTENMLIKPEDMFERLEIAHTKNGDIIEYDEFSIPSNEVQGYYIKEAWYFDQSNSILDVKIVAICPVVFRNALEGFDVSYSEASATREPQFWIPYENIRPYAARMPIMTSDINNVLNKTIDDYFRLRLYDGEIYKTTNMTNKMLIEMYETPELVKEEQEKIEGQLIDFEDGLWVINDSMKVSDGRPREMKINKRDQPKGSSSSDVKHSARDRRKQF